MKKIEYFIKTECKKNSTILRLTIIMINTINVILYGLFFAYGLSENFDVLVQMMDTIIWEEAQGQILTVTERAECLATEKGLAIHYWPGMFPGCVCERIALRVNNHGDLDETEAKALESGKYLFAPKCLIRGHHCAKTYLVNDEQGQEMAHWKAGKKFCVTR
jgi:hypothetical protein